MKPRRARKMAMGPIIENACVASHLVVNASRHSVVIVRFPDLCTTASAYRKAKHTSHNSNVLERERRG